MIRLWQLSGFSVYHKMAGEYQNDTPLNRCADRRAVCVYTVLLLLKASLRVSLKKSEKENEMQKKTRLAHSLLLYVEVHSSERL